MLDSIASQFARIKTKNLVSGWLHGLRQGYHPPSFLAFTADWGLKNLFRRVRDYWALKTAARIKSAFLSD